MQEKKASVWFITGAARGIGFSLARQLLARGDKVAATSRSLGSLHKALGENSANFLALEVDLVSEASVQAAIEMTVSAFGRIDVVVNNAGYALFGTVEAMSDEELRRNFDVNLFAPLHVLRHVLPHLRKQHSGHIFNVASTCGIHGGFPGIGSYVASKFALAGLTETLAAEVAELGIKATAVYPGPVRTEFLSSNNMAVAKRSIPDYAAAQALLDVHQQEMDGKQAGDPEKVALLIQQAAASTAPPLHLFAGKDATALVDQKLESVRRDLTTWRGASEATDFND